MNKSYAVITYKCFTRDFKICNIDLEITDPLGNIAHKVFNKNDVSLKLSFVIAGVFKIKLINKDSFEKQLGIGVDCYYCGKPDFQIPFLGKEHVREKLDRLGQIRMMIGSLMLLTENTKKVFAAFAESKFKDLTKATQTSERRLYLFASLEFLALIVVAIWQAYYIRRVVLKGRMFSII